MSKILQVNEAPKRDKDNQPGKERQVEQVPPALWNLFLDLCDGEGKWPLFVYGPPGTGKSCAALCLADRVEGAKFWQMPALDKQVQEVKQGTAEWYDLGRGGKWTSKTWWNYIGSLPLLILDDVGLPEFSSDSQAETLFMALEARDGKPLICTSNLNEDKIGTTYNDRIQSRMCCGTMYEMRGGDRRREAKPTNKTPAPKAGA